MLNNPFPKAKKIKRSAVIITMVCLLTYIYYSLFTTEPPAKQITESPVEYLHELPIPKTYADIVLKAEATTTDNTKIKAPKMPDIPNAPPPVTTATTNNNKSNEAPVDLPIPPPPTAPGELNNVAPYKKYNMADNIDSQSKEEEEAWNSPISWGNNQSDGNNSETALNNALQAKMDNIGNTKELLKSLMNQGNGRLEKKEEFLERMSQRSEIYLDEKIVDPISPYQIMAGSIMPAVMITGINSDLPGQITAQVRSHIYDSVTGRYLLVPQGTKMIGEYDSNIVYGQNRVLFAWERMIFPNGSSIQLRGMAGADAAGYSGLSDSTNYHIGRIAGAILISAFISTGAEKVDDDTTFGKSVSQGILQSGQSIVQMGIKPTLEVRPGFKFNVIVNKDIVLRPYQN